MEVKELKEFLEVRLDLNMQVSAEKLTNIELQLAHIVEQTTKTNGRVTKLEGQVDVLENRNMSHILNCPVKKEFEDFKLKTDNDYLLLRVMNKYPKASGIIVIILLMLIVSAGADTMYNILMSGVQAVIPVLPIKK